jgi:ABC-2 type transport system permease protein
MLEIARYEGAKRVRGSLAMAAGVVLLTALYVWMFPRITESVDLDRYVEAWPPALREAFGATQLGSIEGFLAAELYAFVWVLLLGIYLAYAAASTIAGPVEDDRMDLLLALPISRRRLLAERFASLLVPIVVLNAVVPVAVYAAVLLIEESLSVADLLAVHLLSVPYLLTTAGVGLGCSVALDRESVAQRAAMAIVFGLFLVDSVVSNTEFAWLGAASPSRYYDPTAILVEGDPGLAGAAVLTGAAVALLAGSAAWFSRRDVH